MRFAQIFGGTLLALSLVACQQNPEKTEKKAEVAVCENLASVGDAIESVQALTPTSTVGDAVKAQKTLATAINKLEKSEESLEKIRVRDLRTQLKTFNEEVEQVSKQSKLTLEQAAQELKVKAQPVIAARQRALAEVECIEEPARKQ
jgi:vacuolar-type H+-ATPase subunit I/STV1